MANPVLIIVLVTCPHESVDIIARTLIDLKLAACVTAIPANSFYYWNGQYCREEEDLLILKSTKEVYPALERQIKSIHPYETPEIIAIKITAVLREYAQWVADQTKLDSGKKAKND